MYLGQNFFVMLARSSAPEPHCPALMSAHFPSGLLLHPPRCTPDDLHMLNRTALPSPLWAAVILHSMKKGANLTGESAYLISSCAAVQAYEFGRKCGTAVLQIPKAGAAKAFTGRIFEHSSQRPAVALETSASVRSGTRGTSTRVSGSKIKQVLRLLQEIPPKKDHHNSPDLSLD